MVGDEPTQTVWLGAGDSQQLIFDNMKQPMLTVSKVEERTNTPIPGTVFTIEAIDGDYRHDVTTGADGTVSLRVAPGSYRVTEKSVPEPYCLPENEADRVQTVSLNAGDEKTLIFKNSKKPRLIVHGAIMEGVFPFAASMEGESLKAFLIDLSRLPGAEETAQKAQKAGDEG